MRGDKSEVWSKEQEKGWQGSSRGKPEERSPEMREETEAGVRQS